MSFCKRLIRALRTLLFGVAIAPVRSSTLIAPHCPVCQSMLWKMASDYSTPYYVCPFERLHASSQAVYPSRETEALRKLPSKPCRPSRPGAWMMAYRQVNGFEVNTQEVDAIRARNMRNHLT